MISRFKFNSSWSFALTLLNSTLFLLTRLQSNAQSIGYQPSLNLGFNPYSSNVFGYGLGLPYGAYGMSPMANPFMSSALLPSHYGGNLVSKLHSKMSFKKLFGYPMYLGSPYDANYGFGKHYGFAKVLNNPYKSAYGDYYNTDTMNEPVASASLNHHLHAPYPVDEPLNFADATKTKLAMAKPYLVKPLIKAGVLLTTAAILGKKSLMVPQAMKLNPAGMIIKSLNRK